MSVDPFEHPPVYKYEQIVTSEDLAHLIIYYAKAEEMLRFMDDTNGADHCCTAHKTIEQLAQWIKDGKPALVEERKDGESD